MQRIKNLFFPCTLLLFNACSNVTKFPVSTVVPAAEITATKKQDKNNNYIITVNAKNLASPERLMPPQNTYSVWVLTEDNGVKNVGQLLTKNSKSVSLETTTPFNVKEIFITAENQGTNSYPSGMEISRAIFKK